MIHKLTLILFVISFVFTLGACGDTWGGLKKDTGENMERTGGALEDAGTKVKG
ncbi:hypothetical protein GUA87_13115 [Sneathiella sp. P13V-1]|uniref:hypothetical protein n=1 Tax=Sneathiella sp. P13V-1 TaxID=2697366 RepID=UPI00187B7408|nr:hypothetical protein [Sneathiella sp. P13V-1]MBE7637790.1 hypothetical protein [Sneathiella sp. P13V-1]